MEKENKEKSKFSKKLTKICNGISIIATLVTITSTISILVKEKRFI